MGINVSQECIHGIQKNSFCMTCQQSKLCDRYDNLCDTIRADSKARGESRRVMDAQTAEIERLREQVRALRDDLQADAIKRVQPDHSRALKHYTGILAELAAEQAAAREAEIDAILHFVPSQISWREAAAKSLLLQAEANRRILYLESVMADIADVIDPIKYPYLMAKINTILYPPSC